MKRVYLLVVVSVLLLSIGKFVLFPSPTTASLETSSELIVPARTSADLPTFDRTAKLATALLSGESESSEDEPEDEASLRVSEILPGLVVPAERVAVRAIASGPISELPVREGDSVDAGQVVVHVDDCEIVAELQRQTSCVASAASRATEGRALLELAEYNHRLNRQLGQKQVVGKAAVIQSELRVKAETAKSAALREGVAVARREEAVLKHRLAKYRTVAPFSGRVTEILRYRDQYVGQGDVILWIESHEKQLKLHLPPELIEKCGAALDRLQVSALLSEDEWLDLTIDAIKPIYNADGSRTVVFKLGPDSTLLTGQFVKMKVTLQGEKS